MNPERYERIQELFLRARELDTDVRGPFLATACGSDGDLRVEVEGLLASDRNPLHSFEPADLVRRALPPGTGLRDVARSALAEVESDSDRPTWVPETIGPYRVLRQIGAGGMGLVFEAVQELTQRRVAVKVLRPGQGSRSQLRRFGVEAQALGRLTHPGVARIYDSGTVQSPLGPLHYFVLELVEGRPLVRWALDHGLDLRRRCELMAEIVDAVHEAHLRSVVHRDLKPANVLVDDQGCPHVLDFGVALLADRDLGTATGRTLAGQVIGTLPYMSPEQASGDVDAVDLRTDVYSLGCVFYELLCGRPAFDAGLPMPELARAIREVAPAPLRVHDPRLRGDLERIVAKAMAKDKEERYPSAAALSADIRRHLAYEPIQARPPSTLYQLRRYARRNRAQVLAGGVALAAVVAGGVASLVFALGERDARRVAAARAEDLLARREVQAVLRAGEFARVGDPRGAREFLDEVRPEARGWEWSLVDALCAPPTETVAETGDTLFFLRTSSDGARLATGGRSGVVLLVDARTHEVLERIPIGDEVRGLEMDASGRRVAGLAWNAAERRGRLFLWEGGELAFLEARESSGPWNAVRFTPDGRTLLFAWNDGSLSAYDLPSRELRYRVQVDPRPIPDADVSSDGRLVALRANRGDVVHVLDVATGAPVRSLPSVARRPADIALDPTGRILVDVTTNDRLRVWDLETGEAWPLGESIPTDPVVSESIAFSPAGDRFYVAVAGEIQVYGCEERRIVDRIRTGGFVLNEFALSPDGVLLAARGGWSSVLVVDTRTGRSLPIPTGLTTAWDVRFGGDGRTLWIVDGTGKLTALDLRGVLSFPGHAAPVTAVAYAWDGDLLLSAARDGTLSAWDPDTASAVGVLAQGATAIEDLAMFPDGERVAVAGSRGYLAVRDLSGAGRERTFAAPETVPWTLVAVDPSGELLLAASHGGDPGSWAGLASWDVRTGEALARVPLDGVEALVLQPRGDWAAVGLADGRLVFLDPRTLAPLREIGGPGRHLFSLAVSPDGTRLASGDALSAILVHDAASGELLVKLQAGPRPEGGNWVTALAFSPDGSRLAAGTYDGRIFLWETAQWELVLELDGHPEEVHDLAFRPDFSQLATASEDRQVGLWDVRRPRERLARVAERERLVEELTPRVERTLAQAGGDAARALEGLPSGRGADARVLRQLLLARARRGASSPAGK